MLSRLWWPSPPKGSRQQKPAALQLPEQRCSTMTWTSEHLTMASLEGGS